MVETIYSKTVTQLEPLMKTFKSNGSEIYDADKTLLKLSALPEYVSESMLKRLNDHKMPLNYDKIILDKWGRKDSESKKFVESPEMVFYRVSMLAAKGLQDKNSEVNYEKTVEKIFTKMVNREIFPNTPYMANGGHKLIAEQIQSNLKLQAMKGVAIDKKLYTALDNDLEQEKKVKEQLFACFVLDIFDSRESIFRTMTEAADIQASIGGTGFNFTYLRPANESIHGTGGTTDGPIAFMAMYSTVLGKTMNQGGKREGANMFELDYNHPDIMRFVYSKRQDGEISAANISIGTWHEFYKAAASDGEDRFFRLINPHYNPKERPHVNQYYTEKQLKQALEVTKMNVKAKTGLLLAENGVDVLSPWIAEGMNEDHRVIGKIKNGEVYLDAKKVLKHLAYGAWYNGEPGAIDLGHINDHNPTLPVHFEKYILNGKDDEAKSLRKKIKTEYMGKPEFKDKSLEDAIHEYVNVRDKQGKPINLPIGVGKIVSTNPCGEKPLLGYEACVLGHTNLENILVKVPTQELASHPSGYKIDMDIFAENVDLMYNMLDNAIDQNHFTLPEIEKTQKSNRKIGVGFMGLANMLYKLEIGYNSKEAIKLVDELLEKWEKISDKASFDKAAKFGVFPNFKYSMLQDGTPKRNAIVRTLAPTGTTGFAAQTTGGMEPEYALAYTRTTVQGTSIDMFNPVLEEKLEKYNFFRTSALKEDRDDLFKFILGAGKGSLQDYTIKRADSESENDFRKRKLNLDKIKSIFVTTYDISPEAHIDMEAIVQNHVDDAVSKTTNFRSNASVDDVERMFLYAHEKGIKGVTFYRDGSRTDQPLKVKGFGEDKKKSLEERIFNLQPGTMEKPTKVPNIMPALKITQPTPFGNLHSFIIYDPTSGKPLETFGLLGNAGSQEAADVEALGRQTSLYLRSGGSLDKQVDQLVPIGSGDQLISRSGTIKSLPMGFGVALKKYQTILSTYTMKDLMAALADGKIDLYKFDEDLSDKIKKGNGGAKVTEFYVPADLSSDKSSSQNSPMNTTKKTMGGSKCGNCGGNTLVPQDGCWICSSCGFSKC